MDLDEQPHQHAATPSTALPATRPEPLDSPELLPTQRPKPPSDLWSLNESDEDQKQAPRPAARRGANISSSMSTIRSLKKSFIYLKYSAICYSDCSW